MSKSILIRGARQLLTLRGSSGPRRGDALNDIGLIEDGSVLIVDGVISSIGPTRRIENLGDARDAEEINASGRVVMPGFVDSHTHLISLPARLTEFRLHNSASGDSGLLTNSTEFNAALNYIRNIPAGTLEHNAARHLESFLRHGTTTVEAKTGYGLNGPAELKTLRVLGNLNDKCMTVVPTFLGAHVVPPEYLGRTQEYLNWLTAEMLPRLRDRKLARFVDVLCSPAGFSVEDARGYLLHARRFGLPAKMHCDIAGPSGAVGLAVEMEAVSVDGLNDADSDDIRLLARSSTVATLLPGHIHHAPNARIPPGRQLIEAGAAVAIATGFHPPVCSTFNMQMVISLACTHMGLTPEQAISAATINAAHAVGLGTRCGSLEYGKPADLSIINVSDYREIPFYFGVNLVYLTMRGGQVVYRDGAVSCGDA